MEKNLIDKGIENIPALVKYGTSKNKNVQQALNSDIANYVIEETHRTKQKINYQISFGRVLQ